MLQYINDEKLPFVIFTDKNRCPLNCYYYFIAVKSRNTSNGSYIVHISLLVVHISFSCELHYWDSMYFTDCFVIFGKNFVFVFIFVNKTVRILSWHIVHIVYLVELECGVF